VKGTTQGDMYQYHSQIKESAEKRVFWCLKDILVGLGALGGLGGV
jgi:hypothetical protein